MSRSSVQVRVLAKFSLACLSISLYNKYLKFGQEKLIRRRGSFERIEGYLEGLEEGSREIVEDPITKKEKQGGSGG
jgi:hypothetical protein